MTDYVERALFLYSGEAESCTDTLAQFEHSSEIEPLPIEKFFADPSGRLQDYQHVVVCASLSALKEILKHARELDFGVGIVPPPKDKLLAREFNLPTRFEDALSLALEAEPPTMDLVYCNGQLMLFHAIVGWIPVLDAPRAQSRWTTLSRSLKRYGKMRLRSFKITTAQQKSISTVACGCMLVQRCEGDYVSKLIEDDSSVRDSSVGVVICSPFSTVEYLQFLWQLFFGQLSSYKAKGSSKKGLPNTVGYIKSQTLEINTQTEMQVQIDGEHYTNTPIICETIPAATRVNLGPSLNPKQQGKQAVSSKETFKVDNLPDEKEAQKSIEKGIPFFSYASEERFKELFMTLGEDARINSNYIVLMLLSTLLASVGLYLNSPAVIIGAMILAPLMAPLVSCAMGLLRGNDEMLQASLQKIALGIVLALSSAALVSLLFPHKPVTSEMLGRLSPNLLDLAVAIFSGIAAAYSKSYKEISQNLAGVAIAVALVPPLAVAGTGLGRGDLDFFLQAFLLFSTNLVGIVLAATLCFRILGYSPAVKKPRALALVVALVLLIAVPLTSSYERVVDRLVFEENLATDRFLVGGKYILVRHVEMTRRGDKLLLNLDILAREPLGREGLTELKRKLQSQFQQQLIIKTQVFYIL